MNLQQAGDGWLEREPAGLDIALDSSRSWLPGRRGWAALFGAALALVPQQLGESQGLSTEFAAEGTNVEFALEDQIVGLPEISDPIVVEIAPTETTTAPAPETVPETVAPTTTQPVATTLAITPAAAIAEAAPPTYTDYFNLVPRLQQLADMGVISQESAAQQINHIEWLHQNTQVTRENCQAMPVDNSTYLNVFAEHPFFNEPIQPNYMVLHWAGQHYEDIFHMANSMLSRRDNAGNPNRVNAHFIIDQHVLARTTPLEYFFRGAHALGFSDSIGIEHNHIISVLDLQPQDVTDIVCTIVYIADLMDWPVDAEHVRDHASLDLIYNNPNYDRNTGILAGPLRKYDYPADAMVVLFLPLAQQVAAEPE